VSKVTLTLGSFIVGACGVFFVFSGTDVGDVGRRNKGSSESDSHSRWQQRRGVYSGLPGPVRVGIEATGSSNFCAMAGHLSVSPFCSATRALKSPRKTYGSD
jgi:hypothetical protein